MGDFLMKRQMLTVSRIILFLGLIVIILSSCGGGSNSSDGNGADSPGTNTPDPPNAFSLDFIQNNVETIARSYQGSFYMNINETTTETFLKGVNIGATIPGSFPGELAISKETYLRWFEMIYDMHANAIRVYTTMNPVFYEALGEFNTDKDHPLYLLQGVWINETTIGTLADAYASDGEIINEFIQDTKDLVDIFHGNKTLLARPGFASGTYTEDVSRYVIGWVLGIEWHPDFVIGTINANPDKTGFAGEYLYTDNASPFEVFLAEVGDTILSYEAVNYQMTRPLSFTNWLTTDLLPHDNEPDPREDLVSVNTEHIKTTEKAFAGMFASYHVYPYYPEFMNYETAYQNWTDPDTGSINPYKAYLNDLISAHTMPVLVAEFGLPSSRGKTHANPQGYDQGGHSEIEQGELLAELLTSIAGTDAMGALIFTWQDEWFKRTWNTMDFDLSWRRPFWSNAETNEQFFGLLTFDPGTPASLHHTDGDMSDWQGIEPVTQTSQTSIYVDSDSRYIYLAIHDTTINWSSDKVYIPVDTIQNQGNSSWQDEQVSFNIDADFVIIINGENNSKILVDQYYDANEYLYSDILDMITPSTTERTLNSGIFEPIYHVLTASFTLPQTGETIPFTMYDAGQLHHGNSNPLSDTYDSLSDFCFGNNFVEIRIPWLLLNVMDPSTKQIISNFNIPHDETFEPETASGFYFSMTHDTQIGFVNVPPGMYYWDEWHSVEYHERLKPSYDIIKTVFNIINE